MERKLVCREKNLHFFRCFLTNLSRISCLLTPTASQGDLILYLHHSPGSCPILRALLRGCGPSCTSQAPSTLGLPPNRVGRLDQGSSRGLGSHSKRDIGWGLQGISCPVLAPPPDLPTMESSKPFLFPSRMLQNNQLGGIPAEALWELPSLQSL